MPTLDYPAASLSARVGLDMVMLLEIDDLCNRRTGRPISVQPPSVQQAVYVATTRRDTNFPNPENFTVMERYCGADIKAPDGRATETMGDTEHWTRVAESHMDSLLVIDGHVWVPVPEPLLRLHTNIDVFAARVTSASVYSARSRHSRDLPRPFGRQSLYQAFEYWSSHTVMESFLDVGSLNGRSIRDMPEWDVHMPSAFDVSHPEKEIIRMAGALVVDLFNYAKGRPQNEKMPHEVQALYGDMYSSLSGEGGHVDFETLETSLEGMLMVLKPTAFSPPRFGPREWRSEDGRIAGMVSAIERTLERWRERTVELELDPPGRKLASGPNI
jgi:hypothetical protein